VAENLRSPGLADQIVMLKDAAMGLELRARLQAENEMLVPQPDQLGEVTVAGNGRWMGK
jgi:hypothetical protein